MLMQYEACGCTASITITAHSSRLTTGMVTEQGLALFVVKKIDSKVEVKSTSTPSPCRAATGPLHASLKPAVSSNMALSWYYPYYISDYEN